MNGVEINEVLAKLRVLKAQAQQSAAEREPPAADFAALLKQSIDSVNATQQQASDLTKVFEQGEDVPLAEVMVSLQKARVSFQAMVEVRNKLVEAYKDIMNMPL
ncbi:flagellar hook-basal body complex protein FliE [Methylothermus subterraneus]